MLTEVDVQALDPERLEALIGPERADRFRANAAAARAVLDGRRVVNVNSTASGGGVAELLQTLLAYVRGLGVDARWHVVSGDARFFEITKRLHNHLYGTTGDGGPLGSEERSHYEGVMRDNAAELLSVVRAGDVVLLHDPQTAGLSGAVREIGAHVAWRCHVGRDEINEHGDLGWEFLQPYIEPCDAYVFTREAFAPAWLDRSRLHVIAPSIDPFSAKNEDLEPRVCRAILQYVGLLADGSLEPAPATFRRRDGSPGRVDRQVDILQTGPPPPADAPLVVQVSRWDRLKDMEGVLRSFAEHVDRGAGAHLALVGPSVHGVADDPEGGVVLDECVDAWSALPASARRRIHLACVPMHDPDEAAIIVNALQRHAAVVTQKSIAEGFGLTVAEAMWKRRPVVGTRVGGIADQIVDGESGLLVDDPHDLEAFGAAVTSLLHDEAMGRRLGEQAYVRAHERFLGDAHLEKFGVLIGALLGADPGSDGEERRRHE
jgi:trehalose synthase